MKNRICSLVLLKRHFFTPHHHHKWWLPSSSPSPSPRSLSTSNCHLNSDSATTRPIKGQKLVYSEFGDPSKVIRKENFQYSEEEQEAFVKGNKAIVKMLASPVNPADINTIQGTYPSKPKELPAIPGNEGVGVVLRVGAGGNPNKLAEHDWVIPRYPIASTWQSVVVAPNSHFIKIPSQMNLATAATLIVNPCTAYRMLKDFKDLKPGDTVIQNGGNSGVGQAVIQLCREFNLNCVSVVRGPNDTKASKNRTEESTPTNRSKEEFDKIKTRLEVELFAGPSNSWSKVITEEELSKMQTKDKEDSIPKAQLALNCVGGKSGTDLLRHLDDGGTMVTYGGMSRQPVICPTSHLIFKKLILTGYWMTRWSTLVDNDPENMSQVRQDMIDYLSDLDMKNRWVPPEHKLVPLAKYREALDNCMKPFSNLKYILVFDH